MAKTACHTERVQALAEGAVEVDKKDQHLLLHQGQQAVVQKGADNTISLNKNVDLDEVLSWKSAEFVFGSGSDFNAIMRQIARWYNVEVVYTGAVNTRFWGSVPRASSIQQVLQLLEATGGVRFDLEGRTLKVIPVK